MSTTIRAEVSRDNEYWIPKHRYYELKHFCMQYRHWHEMLDAINLVGNPDVAVMVIQNGEFSNPVYNATEKREIFLKWINMVETAAANTTHSGTLSKILIDGITNGVTYDILQLRYENMPCSRDTYYKMYRQFFWELDRIRG